MRKGILGSSSRAGAIVIVMLAMLSVAAQGQTPENYRLERQRAFQLFEDHKLENLAVAQPDDIVVLERLGFALAAKAKGIAEAAERKETLIRARGILLRSKQLGNDSNLLRVLLDGISEDGSDRDFSSRKEVDEAMRAGEAAFTRGDFDNAIAAYKRALLLDPSIYAAPLFIGDVYYKKGDAVKAGEWFAQAIAIDPNRETAHRYWGDALMRAGKVDEARLKFVEAIVAEPYNRTAYVGLSQWAARQRIKLAHPNIQAVAAVRTQGGERNITISADALAAKDGTQYWMLYGLARATWPAGRFAKQFPGERAYRHSLDEEADALSMVAEAAAKAIKSGTISAVHPQIAALVKLYEGGLLEAYILFARADAGIAQDYDAYRTKNRDTLRRYWTEVVLPAAQ